MLYAQLPLAFLAMVSQISSSAAKPLFDGVKSRPKGDTAQAGGLNLPNPLDVAASIAEPLMDGFEGKDTVTVTQTAEPIYITVTAWQTTTIGGDTPAPAPSASPEDPMSDPPANPDPQPAASPPPPSEPTAPADPPADTAPQEAPAPTPDTPTPVEPADPSSDTTTTLVSVVVVTPVPA